MQQYATVLGDTLFPVTLVDESSEYYGEEIHDNRVSEYIEDPGDISSRFDYRDDLGVWGVKKRLGSTLGVYEQRRKDCKRQRVSESYAKLAQIQARVNYFDDNYSKEKKYITLANTLCEFFSYQIIGRALELFRMIRDRLTGKLENDISLLLACIEFILQEDGRIMKYQRIEEISEQLEISVTRKKIRKYRMMVREAYAVLHGRETAFKKIHQHPAEVVKKSISEVILALEIDITTATRMRKSAHRVIDELARTRFTPRHYEIQVYAALKIACEELGLVEPTTWYKYLCVDDEMKSAAYQAAYNMRRKCSDWSFIIHDDTDYINGVMTEEEVTKVTRDEVIDEVVTRDTAMSSVAAECGDLKHVTVEENDLPAIAAGDHGVMQSPRRLQELSNKKYFVLNLA
ncbi:MAG: hypothetical protein ACFFD4_36835, partial [Candidatus Odinarchaeota archaeon]